MKFYLIEQPGMTSPPVLGQMPHEAIASLRATRGETLEQFGAAIGVSSKGRISEMENGLRRVTVRQALAIERLAAETPGAVEIDAADLNEDVAAARAKPDWALTPAEIETIPSDTAPLGDASTATLERVIICDVCSQRVDDAVAKSCSFVDCPHSERIAA